MIAIEKFLNDKMKTILGKLLVSILFYLTVLVLSSLSFKVSIFINFIIIVYFTAQWLHNKLNKHKHYIIFISIGNYLTFQIMIASYAEILEWENILLVLFYIQSFFYSYSSMRKSDFKNKK